MSEEEVYEEHTFEYEHEGATWILRIKARDKDDAWQRIHRLQHATYTGISIAYLPGKMTKVGILLCAVANICRRFRLL